MKITRFQTLCALVALLVGAASPAARAASFHVDTIALTGVDDARGPGMGSGVTYSNFQSLRFGPTGSFAFRSALAGGTPYGIFFGNSGGVAPVVLSNSAAPGISGAHFSVVTPAGFFADGNLLYTGELEGAGIDSSNNQAAFITGGTAPVFREGQPAPGLPLTSVTSLTSQVAGNRPTFQAEIVGAGVNASNDVVLYSGTPLTLVAREGTPAANSDLNPGEHFGFMGARGSWVGDVQFQSPILESVGNTQIASGIFSWDGTNITTIARTDQNAVGTVGALYSSFDFRDISPGGDQAYYSVLTGPGVTTANDRALFRTTGTNVSLLAREGDPVPDRPGILLLDVGANTNSAKLGGDGVAVYLGRWNDNGAKGGWIVQRDGVQHLIATRGDVLPGLAPGETMNLPSTNDIPIISENGAVAFVNRSSPTGAGPGLWFYGLDNQLQFVARTGMPLDVDPTSGVDERMISEIDFQSGARMLSDTSLITQLTFTDGSTGLFTFSVVPEPASVVLALLGAVGLTTRRKRS